MTRARVESEPQDWSGHMTRATNALGQAAEDLEFRRWGKALKRLRIVLEEVGAAVVHARRMAREEEEREFERTAAVAEKTGRAINEAERELSHFAEEGRCPTVEKRLNELVDG